MSNLPDDLLEDNDPEELTWQELINRWNPPKNLFVASDHWKEALINLNIPIDNVHLGLVKGPLKSPLNEFNLSNIQELTKVSVILVQINGILKDRQVKVCDITSEAICNVHPKVISKYILQEGIVPLLRNITILPGLFLNLTENNIDKIFK